MATHAELEKVLESDSSDRELARQLGRTPRAVEAKRHRHGHSKHPHRPWSNRDDDTLTVLWSRGATDEEIAQRTGRSSRAVERRRLLKGLRRRRVRPWSDAELRRLEQLLEKGLPLADIAAMLHRSALSIRLRAHRLRSKQRSQSASRKASSRR